MEDLCHHEQAISQIASLYMELAIELTSLESEVAACQALPVQHYHPAAALRETSCK